MSKISFNNKSNPFFTSLKWKVNNYFKENNIHTSGNKKLYIKSSIQLLSAFTIYFFLLFGPSNTPLSILLCIALGFNMAIIGFNVMHEGGHQSLSKYPWLNRFGAYSLNLLGGNTFFWKIKHNINHHTYTNIEGMDSDIDIEPFMRLHEHQGLHWYHRFQHIYCIFLYGISYLVWIFWDDFQKYFTGKIGKESYNKIKGKEHWIFWISKLGYLCVYIIVPMYFAGVVHAVVGFTIVSFACGLSIAVVFQLAHVVEGTSFPSPATSKIEKEWAIHQINTTANFSTKSNIVSWLLGGLNFQVEHHLFPRISHVHYPKINQFVKETCLEFDIPYLEFPSMFKAIQSHFHHIRKMGTTS